MSDLKCPFNGCKSTNLYPRTEKHYNDHADEYEVVCENEWQMHVRHIETEKDYLVKLNKTELWHEQNNNIGETESSLQQV